jgi:cytochrome c oxidase cbb3-type subunit 3
MAGSVQRTFLVVALGCAVFTACDRAPSDVREWKPTDHEPPENAGSVPAQPRPPASAPRESGPELVEVAWEQTCARCHGPSGRGDGPEGMMVRAPDLTRAEWQGRVSDEEIGETIRKGRNKMPAFDLPKGVIDGLVKRIRSRRAPK